MGQKLSEAVEAMGRIQTKVEEMKKDLEITTREKMDLESRKAELISELEVVFSSSECLDTFHLGTFKVCSMRLENLGEVNSSCKEKLGELEVCKSEIGRLADVVEKRFSQVWDRGVFLDFYNFVPGQGGEGGGAATEEQSSSFGRKYARGDKQMIIKSEIGNCK